MIVVGLISGTSYDGIDCSVGELKIDGDLISLHPILTFTQPYPSEVYALIDSTMPPAATGFKEVCQLDTLIGEAFADVASAAILKTGLKPDLIVSHGQTMYHWISEDGEALGTLQIGDASRIAERTGVATLSQLRSRDVAAGGQGAPFASLLDDFLLRDHGSVSAALNLGGISNVTVVSPEDPTIAFDIGPANALIDAAVRIYTDGKENFDNGGTYGAQGVINHQFLENLLQEPYYKMSNPKSTGKELFNKDYLNSKLKEFPDISMLNVIATLTELTAQTVANEINRLSVKSVYVSGGGIHNHTLMRSLRNLSPGVSYHLYEDLGLSSDGKEAYLFALIGFLSLNNIAGNIPSSTGASGPRIMGSLWPGELGFPKIETGTVTKPSLKII